MTGPGTPTSPASIEVFYSYAHEDEGLVKELRKHLSILKRQGVIREWYDREITAGTDWKGQLDQHLNSSGVILLLVSADFLASDYCYDVEMTRALERHDQGEARVIPVLLRKVDGWQGAPFGKLQSLPTDGKPVTSWNDRDEAFADVARGIRRAVSELAVLQPKSSSWPASQPTVLPAPSPQRTPAMDRLTLVRTLTDLTPADFATLIAMIPGAARQLSRVLSPGAGRRADPLGRELDWTGAGGDRGGSQGDSEALDRPAATDGDAGGGPTRRTVPRPPALQLAVYHAGHALQGAAGVPGRPAEEPGEGGPARRGGAWAGGRGQDPGSARVRLEA